MFNRLTRAAAVALFLALLPGCVEISQTITLNPDGKGKVQYEIVTSDLASTLGGALGGPGGGNDGKGEKEKTPAEMLRAFVEKQLTAGKGVSAWKDVSAKWTNDGRMFFTGTAYFVKLDDISATPAPDKGAPGPGPAASGPSWGGFKVEVEKDGLKIIAKSDGKLNIDPLGKPNPMPMGFDPAKATPQEWDDFVLKSRIAYQQMKPFLTMMFSDLKVKTVLKVPGEVKESQGFKKDVGGSLSQTLDGQTVLAGFKKNMTQDVGGWKKMMLAADPKKPLDPKAALEMFGFPADMMEPSLTVHKLGKDQFDFQREVQEARAAYPRLREQLKLSANAKLPGEN